MTPLAGLGIGTGEALIGGGLGLLFGDWENQQQLNQQQQLQNLNIQGYKEMADYNFQKQMEMWEKTNYKAQLDQSKKAYKHKEKVR